MSIAGGLAFPHLPPPRVQALALRKSGLVPRFRNPLPKSHSGLPDISRYQGSMLWSQFSAIFDNFSAKKLAFFSKTNVMIPFLHILASFGVKNANFFRWIFWRKYLNNHNIGTRGRFLKMVLRRSSKFKRSLGRSVIENVLKSCADQLA
jgi:hypothetical protein